MKVLSLFDGMSCGRIAFDRAGIPVEKYYASEIDKYADINGNESIKRVYGLSAKCPTLTAIQGGNQEPKITEDLITWRKLTVRECERLQTVPDGYCKSVSNTRAYHALGNGWTVDVIVHIFRGILNVK